MQATVGEPSHMMAVALRAALARSGDVHGEVCNLRRLTGGATKRTWAFDWVVSGVPQAFNDMLDCMYHGGKVALLGILPKGAGIDWDRIIFKGLTVQGIYGRKMYETWYKMTQMVLTGFPLQKVLTHQVHIDDFQKGFDLMEAGVCGKVVCSW